MLVGVMATAFMYEADAGNNPFNPSPPIPLVRIVPLNASEIDEIKEVAVRYLAGRSKGPYFIDFLVGSSELDPPSKFMLRFLSDRARIKKYSDCRYDVRDGAIDRTTGREGYLLTVSGIDQGSDDLVTIDCGLIESGLSAMIYRYTLQNLRGKWRVIRSELTGIS